MTNEAIIFSAALALMEAGKIGTTGKTITWTDAEGNEQEGPEPEAIHTFARWKDLGYSVKKGEHAVAKLQIWKGAPQHVEIEAKNDRGEAVTVEQDSLKMFKKVAHFFAASQVERRTA